MSYITSFIFKRASIDSGLSQPRGGNYTNPYPTTDGTANGGRDYSWEDSVPVSDNNLPV